MPLTVNGYHVQRDDGQNAVAITQLPSLRETHLRIVLGTMELESFARLHLFPLTQQSFATFARFVFSWAGAAHGPGGLLATPWEDIEQHVHHAIDFLAQNNLVGACDSLDELPDLGVSYASKFLRFIQPDRCGVLDSRIREAYGYAENAQAFADYSNFCQEAVVALAQQQHVLLRVADIDMALFASRMLIEGHWA